jgi:hypothetical protein
MSKLSKKLARAMMEGTVVAENGTAGEVSVWIPTRDGEERTVVIPPYGEAELAPKHTDGPLLKRSRNIHTLLRKGHLRIK